MCIFLRTHFLPNLPVIVALILLSSTPLFLLINEPDTANQNAKYAFYFLIAGVIWKNIQLLTIKQHKDNISSADLQGPMSGKTIADLQSAINALGVNIDLHTKNHPDGELRGTVRTLGS